MVGGRYRLLDFALSSMVNSGVTTIGVITPEKYRSILDHIGAGKPWNLDRKNGGIYILPGSEFGLFSQGKKFLMADLQRNVEILERSSVEYIIVSGCNQVMNVNFTPVVDKTADLQADICLIYKNIKGISADEASGQVLTLAADGSVLDIIMNPDAAGSKEPRPWFIDAFVIKRSLLLKMTDGYSGHGNMDITQIIQRNIQRLKVQSYEHKGYLGRVESLRSYYQCNMDLLNHGVRHELFLGENKIFTKVKENPPTKYGAWSQAEDSIIAGGCTVNGKIERTVLFRGVQVETGAVVKNSIIMSDSYIGKDSILENVILDKYTYITDRSQIKGKAEEPLLILDRRMKLIHREKEREQV
jgi:glucose-1-phosphate adenylyltransferase